MAKLRLLQSAAARGQAALLTASGRPRRSRGQRGSGADSQRARHASRRVRARSAAPPRAGGEIEAPPRHRIGARLLHRRRTTRRGCSTAPTWRLQRGDRAKTRPDDERRSPRRRATSCDASPAPFGPTLSRRAAPRAECGGGDRGGGGAPRAQWPRASRRRRRRLEYKRGDGRARRPRAEATLAAGAGAARRSHWPGAAARLTSWRRRERWSPASRCDGAHASTTCWRRACGDLEFARDRARCAAARGAARWATSAFGGGSPRRRVRAAAAPVAASELAIPRASLMPAPPDRISRMSRARDVAGEDDTDPSPPERRSRAVVKFADDEGSTDERV